MDAYEVEEIPLDGRADPGDLKRAFNTFREYHEEAQFNPRWGYYSSGRARIGDGGDFTTYAEMLSPIFGEMAAKLIFSLWHHLETRGAHEGAQFTVLIPGDGNGTLAHNILSYASKRPEPLWMRLYEDLVCIDAEISPALRKMQEMRNEEFGEHFRAVEADARRLSDYVEAPFRGVILSSELLDALGIERLRIKRGFVDDGRYEVCLSIPTLSEGFLEEIGLPALGERLSSSSEDLEESLFLPAIDGRIYVSKGNFLELMDLLSGDPRRELLDRALRFFEAFVPGDLFPEYGDYVRFNRPYIVERLIYSKGSPLLLPVIPASAHYIREAGGILKEPGSTGFVVTIDYGGSGRSLFERGFYRSPDMREAVRCFSKPFMATNPYLSPGKFDITADVNFSWLDCAGRWSGLQTVFFGPQSSLATPRLETGSADPIDPMDPDGPVDLSSPRLKDLCLGDIGFSMLIQAPPGAAVGYLNPFARIWCLPKGLPLSPDDTPFLRQGLSQDDLKDIVDVSGDRGLPAALAVWAREGRDLMQSLVYRYMDDDRGLRTLRALEKKGLVLRDDVEGC